jgi:hypothetical protein
MDKDFILSFEQEETEIARNLRFLCFFLFIPREGLRDRYFCGIQSKNRAYEQPILNQSFAASILGFGTRIDLTRLIHQRH